MPWSLVQVWVYCDDGSKLWSRVSWESDEDAPQGSTGLAAVASSQEGMRAVTFGGRDTDGAAAFNTFNSRLCVITVEQRMANGG